MASFAKRIKGNESYSAAAKDLGIKPKQATREAFQRVKAYAAGKASGRNSAPQKSNNNRNNTQSQYRNATTGGSYVDTGIDLIGDLMNKYPGNQTLAGLGTGSIFDIGRTQANTGLAIAYNDAFLASLGKYQEGVETLKTANTEKLMASEGAIARDLMDLTTGRQLDATKYTADRGLESNKYTADRNLDSNRYVADRGLEGSKYTADQALAGAKYGYDSQERQIGLKGAQDRLNMNEETNQQLRLRTDARGAIRSQGARFYG